MKHFKNISEAIHFEEVTIFLIEEESSTRVIKEYTKIY